MVLARPLVGDAKAGRFRLAGIGERAQRAAALAADRPVFPGAELLVATAATIPATTATATAIPATAATATAAIPAAATAVPATATATAAATALAATDDAEAGSFGRAGVGKGLALIAALRADRVIFARAELRARARTWREWPWSGALIHHHAGCEHQRQQRGDSCFSCKGLCRKRHGNIPSCSRPSRELFQPLPRSWRFCQRYQPALDLPLGTRQSGQWRCLGMPYMSATLRSVAAIILQPSRFRVI